MKNKVIEVILLAGLVSILFTSCSNANTAVTSKEKTLNKQEHVKISKGDKIGLSEGSEDEIVPDNRNKYNVKLVSYTGKIEHVFIHPLIAYPELAFDGDSQSLGFDDWFITIGEFNKILNSLYEKNFIVVDINKAYEEVELNGKKIMKRKPLILPKGKKPIILSLDDVNYYKYMIENGTVYKLIIDENGELATYSKNSQGKEVISKENESITILNEFVKKHPDFSSGGAKGIIALTGYEGILGYRTNAGADNIEVESATVKKIIDRLKRDGWTFASHSYGHPNLTQITEEKLVSDTAKWKNQVESLIGYTQVYIYPFGSAVTQDKGKFQYLQSQGFKIFCAVGSSSYEEIPTNSDVVITDRRHIDGISLRNQRKSFLDLYDADKIIDLNTRPKR